MNSIFESTTFAQDKEVADDFLMRDKPKFCNERFIKLITEEVDFQKSVGL